MEINLSLEEARILKEISKLSEEEKLIIDGVILSTMPDVKKIPLAYKLTRKHDPTGTEESIYQQARRWYRTKPVQYYIDYKQGKHVIKTVGTSTDEEGKFENVAVTDMAMNKEKYLRMLNKNLEIANREKNPKLVAQIIATIHQITQFGKEKSDKDNDSKITYFRQINCHECPMYTDKLAELKLKKLIE